MTQKVLTKKEQRNWTASLLKTFVLQRTLTRMWRNKTPCALLLGMYNGAVAVEGIEQFIKKLNVELRYDPVIPFLGMYSKELNPGTQTYTFTPIFIATLFYQKIEATQVSINR